jgi:hypothetical protein
MIIKVVDTIMISGYYRRFKPSRVVILVKIVDQPYDSRLEHLAAMPILLLFLMLPVGDRRYGYRQLSGRPGPSGNKLYGENVRVWANFYISVIDSIYLLSTAYNRRIDYYLEAP